MPASPIAPLRRPGILAWLDTTSPFASVLESRLEEIAAIPSRFIPIPTRSRSRRLWEGNIDGVPGAVILKQRWINPSYDLPRRISCRVSLAMENPFRRALALAPRLAAAGIPAIRPVLCWKKSHGLFPVEEGILYPKLEATASLRRYLGGRPAGGPSRVTTRLVQLPLETLSALARFLRTLNAAGFVHLDPSPQNVLLLPGAADPPTEASFAFIDVEAFRPLGDGRPDTPRARYARALAIAPLLPYLSPSDLPPFAESFALPGESPASWLRLLGWVRSHSRPRLPGKLLLFLRALSFRS